jgi:hypothetical protein
MTEITGFELFQTITHIRILEQISRNEITSGREKEIVKLLDCLFTNFFYLRHEYLFEEIYRITINKNILKSNRRIKDIGHLKYPPDKTYVTKYGRCNLPGQPIFYGSLMRMTSLNELKPKVGDLITESTWVPKTNKPILYFPIFLNQPTNQPFINRETGEVIPRLTNIRTLEMETAFDDFLKDYPQNTKKHYYAIMQFIADCFSKPINSANHWNYLYSAYLSDKFFNVVEEGKIEAIYYPSVPDKLNSENLAIKPDTFDNTYKLSKIEESILFQDPTDGRGGYGMDAVANCTSFNHETNEILWGDEEYIFSKEKLEYYKKHFGLNLD